MILIWRGWGVLAALIPLLLCVVPAAIVAGTTANTAAVGATVFITGLLSAWLVWSLGRRWNSAPGREFIDAASGQHVVVRPSHTLFWIPMQWYAPVIALFAVVDGLATLFSTIAR
ncbi:MAG: hypothetical protein ACREMP_05125 [Candidatus Tyrphobacter sp.]